MKHLRRLMEARRLLTLVPDQGLIASGQGTGADYLAACRGSDFAFVYAATGQQFTVNLGKVSARP
jgi:phosphopantothenate synthetase